MVVFAVVIYKAFIGFSWYVSFYNLFSISNTNGMLIDYKFLRGNTVNHETNFGRVLSAFNYGRQPNLKTSSWLDISTTTVRYSKRVDSFTRTFYGPIRPRWFR